MALALALNISLAGLYRKLNGGTWKPNEIELVCRRYDVQPNDVFSGQPVVDGRRLTVADVRVEPDGDKGPDGNGGAKVRHQGLEPRTRWFGVARTERHPADLGEHVAQAA